MRSVEAINQTTSVYSKTYIIVIGHAMRRIGNISANCQKTKAVIHSKIDLICDTSFGL